MSKTPRPANDNDAPIQIRMGGRLIPVIGTIGADDRVYLDPRYADDLMRRAVPIGEALARMDKTDA